MKYKNSIEGFSVGGIQTMAQSPEGPCPVSSCSNPKLVTFKVLLFSITVLTI
jgi:hypothetical protein